MKVFIEKNNVTHNIIFSGTGKDLCRMLDINIETIIIVRNGYIVTEDYMLDDNDEVELLSVVSGG
ncbi:MAG: MoaD/ThiS family protein [Candidatus Woesearchaeota archaeon]